MLRYIRIDWEHFLIKCHLLRIWLECVLNPYHIGNRFVKAAIYACRNSYADRRAKPCCSVYFVTHRWDIEYIREYLHEQVAIGTASGNDDLVETDAQLIAHIIYMLLHRQCNCFQNRAIDMASCMSSVKADHYALLI